MDNLCINIDNYLGLQQAPRPLSLLKNLLASPFGKTTVLCKSAPFGLSDLLVNFGLPNPEELEYQNIATV